ncbi:hypothetical protein HDU85_000929 [Gaertneriomyces sp. JEL0708]|nr:hypothetical protein HDU85_000929 [Gaertneriomyces sp. JEL0708]
MAIFPLIKSPHLPSFFTPSSYATPLSPRPNRRSSVILAHATTWIVTIILLLFSGLFYRYVSPPTAYFSVTDTSLMAPYLEEKFSSFWSTFISVAAPIVCMVLVQCLWIGSIWDLYAAIAGLVQALALSLAGCAFLWGTVGGLRPYHLTVCDPDPALTSNTQRYYDNSVCRGGISKIDLHGFPSGHAATVFACWLFLSFWLTGKFKPFANYPHLLSILLILFPLFMASWIAMSRIRDFRHFGYQVFWGAVIGIVSTTLVYRLHYRSWLWGDNSGVCTEKAGSQSCFGRERMNG